MMNSKILVADDDPDIRDILIEMLSKEGFWVIAADNGENAVKIVESQNINLAILDIDMPKMNGIEALHRIKAIDPGIEVLIITGNANLESLRMTIAGNGAFDYILKPFFRVELINTVQNALVKQAFLQKKDPGKKEADQRLIHLSADFEKRTEELRESQIKYREIVESSGDSIIIFQANRIRFANNNMSTLSGYSMKEIFDIPFSDLLIDEDKKMVRENLDNVSAGVIKSDEAPFIFRFRLKRKNGDCLWIGAGNKKTIWNEHPAVLCFLRDITDKKRAEEILKNAHEQLEKKVAQKTIELTRANLRLKKEIAERKQVDASLRKNEMYLQNIMATIQTAVIIVDARTDKIVDANPFFLKITGFLKRNLIGTDCNKLIFPDISQDNSWDTPQKSFEKFSSDMTSTDDCLLQTAGDGTHYVRRSTACIHIDDQDYIIQSLSDITDIKNLLKKQEINIGLAKNILNLINKTPLRHIPLTKTLSMFVESISLPCLKEGGDHFFVQPIQKKGSTKTVISVKDQSGHSVNCILRSIVTDLIHQSVLHQYPDLSSEQALAVLNNTICTSGLFETGDFVTAMTAVIEHDTLEMRYVSNGHPPFVLIRDSNIVSLLPDFDGPGSNIPIGWDQNRSFSAGTIQIQKGDRLIFFTDGLTEMPQINHNRIITMTDLKKKMEEISAKNSGIRVSEIMKKLIQFASDKSGLDIRTGGNNTSGDDITILGLEIEDDDCWEENQLYIKESSEISSIVARLYERISTRLLTLGFQDLNFRLYLLLEETIQNAWKHGNNMNPDLPVNVSWRFGNDFHLCVCDQGTGFDFNDIPDPTLKANITRSFGRGIYLIRNFATSVNFKENGNKIIITMGRTHEKNKQDKQNSNFLNLWENIHSS